jgi:hypothetical protein
MIRTGPSLPGASRKTKAEPSSGVPQRFMRCPLKKMPANWDRETRAIKRLLADKTVEVDFFRRALQKVEARRQQSGISGEKASSTKFRDAVARRFEYRANVRIGPGEPSGVLPLP